MFYETHSKICISAFCISFFGYLFSPSYTIPVSIQEVSAKEATTTTGSVESRVDAKIQAWGKEDWQKKQLWTKLDGWVSWPLQAKPETIPISCDADCKIRELTRLGIRSEISTALVTNCKALARDPLMCVKIWASIVKNESGGGFKCRKYNQYNCFWLQVKDNYKSYNDSVLHWVWKYENRWYKAKNMSFFYSSAWNLPPSRYCTSEDSSNTAIWCPHWLKISTDFFNSLPF